MDALYTKDTKLYATNYMEIYVPSDYFTTGAAVNKGTMIETFGIAYVRAYPNGEAGDVQLLNIPAIINLMLYESRREEIRVKGKKLEVVTLSFPKDSFVMYKSLQQGRVVAEVFLNSVLAGKLPASLDYANTINAWWKNLEIAGVDYKVPSKMLEMILAAIYRSEANFKDRFGQVYGQSANSSGYNYRTGNVRDIVESLSTFSGMIFEDIGRMITSGINNSNDGIEEPVSPLETIIRK